MHQNDYVIQLVQTALSDGSLEPRVKLQRSLRILAKYRSHLIANTLVRDHGLEVRTGPFAGMTMPGRVTEGCYVPKLLGCYEQELHPALRSIASRHYDVVLNIGSAEGYYAVGLARLLPRSAIHAHDTDPAAQLACGDLARRNGVAERVSVGGEFRPEDFAAFEGKSVLLVCDIEGAELTLLDVARAPSLRHFDILLEMHDLFDASTSRQLLGRFADSHQITRIDAGDRKLSEYPELHALDPLDQLLAVWEWRMGPTPWAFMEARLRR